MHEMTSISLLLIFIFVGNVAPHGNMLSPLNRASIWRDPNFAHLNPRENWNDREVICGGYATQHFVNGGNCGPCGDSWSDPVPRIHENTGYFGQSIITKTYSEGQVIPIQIYLQAEHQGHFEFHICPLPHPNSVETNECFTHVLQQSNGQGPNFIVNRGSGTYNMEYKLPAGLKCSRCVLRWHYPTANYWGDCGNGTEGLGCGPQENFRNCADITIQ